MNHEKWEQIISVDDMLSEKIDGEVFEYSRSNRCRICTAPTSLSKLVDSLLVQPFTFAQIIRLIEPLQDELGVDQKDKIVYSSLINHRANHLPFEKIAVRLMLEEKARERGKKILEGVDSILTADAYFTRVGDISFNQLNEGAVVPTITEGMRAMQLKYEMEEANKGDSHYEVLLSQFNILVELIKKYCDADQINSIVAEIEASKRTSPMSPMPAIEDAQIV